jgi:hypothetical protein
MIKGNLFDSVSKGISNLSHEMQGNAYFIAKNARREGHFYSSRKAGKRRVDPLEEGVSPSGRQFDKTS